MGFDIMNPDFTAAPVEQAEETNYIKPPEDSPKETVGFWEFFGLIVLFAIPIVGFISAIVFMFSPKRKSMKNYARAVFTWMMIRLVTAIIVVSLLVNLIGNLILPTINAQFNTKFENISEVVALAGNLMNGNYPAVVKILKPQLTDTLGQQYEPLFEELSKEKYNDLFEQVAEQDYNELLEDFKSGEYEALAQAIGEQDFNGLVNELESAANGESSELFDSINNIFSVFKQIK